MSTEPEGRRATALLALAGFFSSAAFRVCDPLLPLLASEFSTSTGAAAYTITVFSIAYGGLQVFWGPLGDRYGKYRTAAFATFACAVGNIGAVFAPTLTLLIVCRGIAGATGGGIIPLALAWMGDTIPYARRQEVLARFMTWTILGIACGGFLGGFFGDTLGWRWAFGMLAASYVIVGVLLQIELRRLANAVRSRPMGEPVAEPSPRPSFARQAAAILSERWPRVVLATVAFEGAIVFGALTFVPFDVHQRFGLTLTAAGGVVSAYGLGGVGYTLFARRLVGRLGERGLAHIGGLVCLLAFGALALARDWPVSLAACFAIGFGFYMLHNTLQTNATQMAPHARGTAVAMFASCLFIGQSIGVAMSALVVDSAGPLWLFAAASIMMPTLASSFAGALRHRPAQHFS